MDGILGVADAVLTWLAGLDPRLVYGLTGVFTALETTALIGLVVPGDAVVLLAGSTVTSVEAYAMVVAAATVGALTGETGGYLIGRAVGPGLRHSRLGRMIGEKRWARAEAHLATHRGASALVAVRFIAVVHAVAPLIAGAVRMPYRRFIGWAGLGTVIWSTVFTGAGALAGASYREYGHISLVGTVVAGALLGASPMVVMALRRRGARREARRAAAAGTGALWPP
jgi:membrane-associated protein